MKLSALLVAASLSLVAGSAVLAQTAPASPSTTAAPAGKRPGMLGMFKHPKPATPPGAAPTTKASTTPATAQVGGKPRTPISLSCSSQADARGLHGKDRKSFRRTCMKG